MNQSDFASRPASFLRHTVDWWLAQVKHVLPLTLFFFVVSRRQGAEREGRLGLKKPVQNLIMETPPVLCTFGQRVAELSLARSEAVGLRLIHQPGPDQRLFHFDDVMIHPYAVLGFLVFCAAAAWTMALIV